MWKIVDGRSIQTTDESRVELEARISAEVLASFDKIAEEHNSYRNYVIENGLINLLIHNEITFNKKNRPKDRIRYRSTYDKDLVDSLREFAKEHKLYTGDVIEYSLSYVNVEELKSRGHRFRIEH